MNRCHLRGISVACGAISTLFSSLVALAQTPASAPAAAAEVSPSGADQPNAPATSPAPPRADEPPTSAPAPNINLSSQPKIQLASQAPAPAPVIQRTDRTHDGFYARLSLGFASQGTTIDDGVRAPNFHARSGALVIDAMVGGAPAPGIILGGAFLFDRLPSTTFEVDGVQGKTGTMLMTIGPFIDGYPNPRGGFHLGGTVGPCFARLKNNADFVGTKSNGFGLAAWFGYDWWVADQWSVGGLLRFSGSNTTNPDGSPALSVDTRSIALMFTAVYQ